MLRHVVVFNWKPSTAAGDVDALRAGLAELPGRIPEIRVYSFGPDAGVGSQNADFALVADFDDADSFRRYVAHPDHQALIADLVAPIVATRQAVQFVVDG
ncbi:MAG: Dabb family protein [Acidimicrobiales bacterium]